MKSRRWRPPGERVNTRRFRVESSQLATAVLNAIFGLGSSKLQPIPALPGISPKLFLILGAVQSVLLAPILAIVIAFGEEYGWRGYLKNELFKLGRVRGVLLLGVIWGAWHWPLILMGYNYQGRPLLGLLLMVRYTRGSLPIQSVKGCRNNLCAKGHLSLST